MRISQRQEQLLLLLEKHMYVTSHAEYKTLYAVGQHGKA